MKNIYIKTILISVIIFSYSKYILCQDTDSLIIDYEILQDDKLLEESPNEGKWFKSTRITPYNNCSGDSVTSYGDLARDYIIRNINEPNNAPGDPIAIDPNDPSQTSNSIPWWPMEPIGPTTMPATVNARSIGTPSGIGLIQSVWANPNITSTIYAGGMNGGLWKKEFDGQWVNLTDHILSFGVLDIAVDPSNPQIIYIATGCFVSNGSSINPVEDGGYGLGVFKSIDGGNSWHTTMSNSIPSEDLFTVKVVIAPNNPNRIYALTKKKVFMSSNGGIGWTDMEIPSSNTTQFIDIVFKPNNSNTIFICAEEGEFYRSNDAGESWSTNLANYLVKP